MSETALRNYLHNIDQIIEQKHYDEAVAHCKHVLGHYPKNLEAYRLLAKALLEKGRHGDAADIFQRVLSVAPDDFLAHVGMAIVREDEANLSAALWHMERAFEANPSNPAIQEELKRLYGRRDGMPPARARLTRGALARMYLKGELYPQAEAELRTALMEDPERLDLTAMLARVLLETGRRAEAADLCQTVLQKLPYNQEANRVLADILKHQGREPEAKPYLQRLEALDPYEAFADGYTAHNVKPEAVTLPELILDQDGQAITPRKPEWAEALGEEIETGLGAGSVFSSDEPEWLKEGTNSLMGGPLPVTGELPDPGEVPDWLKNVEPLEAAPAAAADLPDWMKATTGMLADRPADTGTPLGKKKGTSQLSGWLSSDQAMPPLSGAVSAGDDVPDWMKGLQPPTSEGAPTVSFGDDDFGPTSVLPNDQMPTMELDNNTAMFGEQPTSVLPPSGFQEDLPDWLKPAEPAKPVADLPDWLKSSTGELSTSISSAMLTGGPEEIASTAAFANMTPEWLKTMAAEGEAAAPDEDLSDWLKNATGKLTPSAEVTPAEPAPTADAGALPDWLQGTGNLPATPEKPAGDVPDWLNVSTGSLSASTPAAEAGDDLPPWLQGTGNLPPEKPASEAPSWLKVETGPLAEQSIEPAATEGDDLPDWLKGAGGTGLLAGGAALAASAMAQPEPEKPQTFPAEIELPDFLQPASAEAIARAETPVDWDEEETAPANTEAVAEDVPDWIKAMAPAAQPEVNLAEDEVAKVAEDELPDWLQAPTKPTGELPDVLPADDLPLPPAAEPALSASKPGSSETIRTWLSDKDVPEWLRQARTEAAEPEPEALAEEASAVEFPDWLKAMQTDPGKEAQTEGPLLLPTGILPEEATAEPAAEMPDFASMSEDEQMRWLESLAARQGADPAELITQPAEQFELPPVEPTLTPPTGPIMPATGILPEEVASPAQPEAMPDWLKAMQTDYPQASAPEPVEAEAPAEPAAEMPDFASMSEDEQMRWLETLAARQGADPAELITQPEASEPEEKTATGPLMPRTGILPPLPEEPELAPAEPVSAVPDFSTMSEDDQMRWLETLAARQGADPAELITQPEVEVFVPIERPATGPLMPRTGILPPLPEEPELAPAQPVNAVPDFSTMSEDEQMRWLESLAARQGADPAELITQPEVEVFVPIERPATGPVMPSTGVLPPMEDEAPVEPAVPDFASMSEDEQMRWLESLAARQGADPAELITQPEERFELPPVEPTPTPPTGPIMPATGILPSFGAEPEEEPLAPLTPEETRTELPGWLAAEAEPTSPPDWLKAIQIATAPKAEVSEVSPPPSEPVVDAVDADVAHMDDEAQMRWLESLAARQGADPAELITPAEERPVLPVMPEVEPEPEPMAGPPDWVKAATEEVTPPAEEAPATPAEEEIPAWIRAATHTGLLRTPPPEPEPKPEPKPVTPPPAPKPEPARAESGDDRISRLAEQLTAKRRQRDEEVAARLEKERAEREAAMRAVEESMEARRTRRTDSETGSLRKGGTGMLGKPGTGPLAEPIPEPTPELEAPATPVAPRAEAKRRPAPPVDEEEEQPRPSRRRQEPIRLPAGTRLKRSRKSKPKKAAFAGQSARDVLGAARSHLNQREYAPAVEQFEYLIRSGENLKEVVAELENFVNANENAGVFFRVLGDAYMRSGQLQPALDAYRQALTQM